MLLGKDLFLLGLFFFMHFKYSLGTFPGREQILVPFIIHVSLKVLCVQKQKQDADKDSDAGKQHTIEPEFPREYCQSVYSHALLEDVSGKKASSVCYFF